MKFSRDRKKIFVIFFILFLLTGGWYYHYGLQPVNPKDSRNFKIVEIKKGDGVFTIANKLADAGVIKSRLVFILEALRTGVYKKFQAGEYAFNLNQDLHQIFKILTEGRVVYHKVVIPEGLTLWQIAEVLEENHICKKEDFLKLAKSPEIAKKFGLPGPTLEGYLYPDTYYFPKNTHPGIVIKTMVDNFWKHWKKYEKIAKKEGKSLKEVITLASIVEKEALFDREKPIIAAVYLNRLKRGMPLQADPTVNYALKKFRRLTYKDYYTVNSPYNTYLNPGLPPTPICSPGEASIKAVLFPAKVRYLYFVAKGDGTHYFSRTYRQHLRAIRKARRYRRWLRRIRRLRRLRRLRRHRHKHIQVKVSYKKSAKKRHTKGETL